MSDQRCFCLRDAMVLAVACVVMLSMVMVGCDDIFPPERRPRRRSRNGTQVRGLQQAFVLYSQSNNEHYPGYDSDGNDDFAALAATPGKFGSNALTDDDLSKVYAILINADFFTPEYIISPKDTGVTQAVLDADVASVITSANYSYALLDMNDADSDRRSEWKDTNNSQAPLVADPSSDIRPLKTVTYYSSVSAKDGDSDVDYQGNIAWNDNHVTFETSALFQPGKIKMGNEANNAAINLFKNTDKDGAKFIW